MSGDPEEAERTTSGVDVHSDRAGCLAREERVAHERTDVDQVDGVARAFISRVPCC